MTVTANRDGAHVLIRMDVDTAAEYMAGHANEFAPELGWLQKHEQTTYDVVDALAGVFGMHRSDLISAEPAEIIQDAGDDTRSSEESTCQQCGVDVNRPGAFRRDSNGLITCLNGTPHDSGWKIVR